MSSIAEYDRYITRRGYTIKKDSLNQTEERKIRKELHVQPFEKQKYMMEKFGTLPPSFKVYLESANKLYIPRYYGIDNFGPAIDKIGDVGNNINLKFRGELRDYQIDIMDKFMKLFKKNKGGILNLKTGGGKTALALYIISVMKKKTLVVVHKEFLMNQWIERISQFLPDARIGIIQANKVKVDNCDIVIGMLQSISQRNYPENTFDSFGLNILDEIHNFASNCYSRAFPKISTQYNLGLSATVKRKDNMERILSWHIGPVFSPTGTSNNFGEVNCFMLPFSDPNYQQTFYNFKGNANMPKMINRMVESPNREKLIIDLLKHFSSVGRKTLVLSERRRQVESLQKKLDEIGISNGLCIGGIKQKELDDIVKRDVLLATYSYVQEAFDVPELNTLIFATPKSDIIQASGRILRQTPENRKFIPVIVDIVDSTPGMVKKSNVRKKFYHKSDFTIKDVKNTKDIIIHTSKS
ncbi:MAG: hypothetical protein Ct9H90mP28_2220 [Paracoccaceae bacterium]|nr:MAG: hypothetical protein Ct9H90mP28_2220 [Paracoccaceae bacterium]